MRLGRLFQRKPQAEPVAAVEEPPVQIDARQLPGIFSAPQWLRDLGFLAWFLVGVGVLLVGLVWIFDTISSIAIPVIVGGIVASVAGPLVNRMERGRIPRAAGAAIVILALVGVAVGVTLLVLGGIVDQSDQIKAAANEALAKVQSWSGDADANSTEATSSIAAAVPDAGRTFLTGLANGIRGLTSIAIGLSFTLFSTFFLLKDGPKIRGWVNGHLGVPHAVASTITGRTISSMRAYFFGLTIVAVFNGAVVGLGAWVLGVPLAGTIAIVTAMLAYIPFIGAFVAGAFAVVLALASEGTTTALIMLVIVLLANGLLQNIVQPIAFGATLDLNPLAVLVVTIAAGALVGMIGMIIAAPLLSAAVKVTGDLRRARLAALPPEPPPEAPSLDPEPAT